MFSAVLNGISSILRFDKQTSEHANASFRYADLVSDAEEIMSKRRQFRPECDLTIQNFKNRSDNLSRYSPHVDIDLTDDELGLT